jgi:hypothetical protein
MLVRSLQVDHGVTVEADAPVVLQAFAPRGGRASACGLASRALNFVKVAERD